MPAYCWWLTQTKVLFLYLKLTILPWPLAIYYQMPYLTTLAAAWPWLMLTILLIIGALILLWRHNAIGFVGAWVLLILSPTLIVPITTEVAAERRMYLPLAALAVLVVAGGYVLARQVFRRLTTDGAAQKEFAGRWSLAVTTSGAIALAAVLSLITFQRLAAYHQESTLWRDVLAAQPENPVAHYNLAIALANMDQVPEAIVEYQAALRIQPNYADAHNYLGNALLKLNQPQDALGEYQTALGLKPNYPDAHSNLAAALVDLGRLQEAIGHCHQALELNPDFPEAHCNLGVAWAKLGKTQEAIAEYREALRLKPRCFNAHYNLGNTLLEAGQTQEAVEHFEQAIRMKPNDPQARYNLGNATATNWPT